MQRENKNELVHHIYANVILVLLGIAVMTTGYIKDYNLMVTVGSLATGFGAYKTYNYYQKWKNE